MPIFKELAKQGQSIWLDTIDRDLIESGQLAKLVQEDGLMGVTSNPAIFEKAINSGSNHYTAYLKSLKATSNPSTKDLYESLAIRDIQDAADILLPVYKQSQKRDGYVSLEVSPYLARDSQGSIEEAKRLWKQVARPNLMIKIPGTPECMPAIQALIEQGININVTLLFSKALYEQCAEAYLSGLETRVSNNQPIDSIASVASFFISRIDSALPQYGGQVAIANAKLAYQSYKNLVKQARFLKLKTKGAQSQRLLWASTSTKDPSYKDILYVEELIGPDTVNTMPPATYEAFKDHGIVKPTLESNLNEAKALLEKLHEDHVHLDSVTDKLLTDGIELFQKPFDKILHAINGLS